MPFLVRASVRRPGVVVFLALVLLAYGIWRLATASLDIFPEFSPPLAIVQTEAAGYSAEQVERLVSLPVEAALAGAIGVESVRSQSIQGLSVVTAVFDDSTDRREARRAATDRLAPLAGRMPPGVAAPAPVPFSSSSATVMTIGLTSDARSPAELRALAAAAVAPRLLRARGVADVNIFGGEERQWQAQADIAAMTRLGLTFDDLAGAARAAAARRGGGFVETPTQQLALSAGARGAAPADIAAAVVRADDAGAVRLGDAAVIAPGAAPAIGRATVDGEPGVVIMAIGQFGANTAAVSREIDAALADLGPALARNGVVLHDDLFRPATYIQRSLEGIAEHMAAGSALAAAVLAAFLFSARAVLVTAAAIPLSLIAAAVVLLEFGANLNVMALGGLAIALGEAVDDAIVDAENVCRRLRENAVRFAPRAARDVVFGASMEIRGSVAWASFIVVLAFAPLLSMPGVAGRMFQPVGAVYVLAIAASLLVALTVTPALCVLLLSRPSADARQPPLVRLLRPAYERALRLVARRDRPTIVVAAAAVAAGLAALPGLESRFLPELREGHYMIHTSGVPGTSLAETIRVGTRLTEEVREIPGVRKMSQWAGRAERGADTFGSHYAEYEVDLERLSGPEQQRALDAIRGVLDRFPGIATEVNTFLIERVEETATGYAADVAVNIYGSNLNLLEAAGQEAAALMRALPGAADVRVRAPQGAPALAVEPDPERLAFHGVRADAVFGALHAAFEGRQAGVIHEGDRAIPLVVTLPPEARARPGIVAELPVAARGGRVVTLGEVARVTPDSTRSVILREGGRRVQTVTCNIVGVDAGRFLAALEERLRAVRLPADSHIEIAGSEIEGGAARRELLLHAALAGAGALLLLYLALGNAVNTALIVVNLPFSLVGGALAALWTGGALSLGSFVGFVTLFGITLRNSIMLVSHYRHLVEVEGLPWGMDTAIRGAGERLPSILMTALVTALALLPIAVGADNPGREIIGPMAAVIVGGIATSTVLNLLILPAIMARYGRFRARAPSATI